MTQELWRCGPFDFDLRDEPVIMGILNVTPDSFSDGGEHNALPDALAWAEKMRGDGARIIDVGGESTRPGATEVPLEEERSRVIPVVKALAKEGFCVSVDTSRPEIMLEAAEAGAAILNDVRAFERPGALEAAASTKLGLVIMHQGPFDPEKDVVEDAFRYLGRREEALRALTQAEAMDIDEIDRALALRLLQLVRYRLEHPDYLTRNEYGTLLLDSFDRLRNELPLGYALFHLPWVLEWYKANRQYKKACELLEAYFPEKSP